MVVPLGLIALAAPGARAQQASRPLGVLLSHSMTSATASDGPECLCGERADVLAPISLSSIEVELTLPLRTTARGGVEMPLRAVPLVVVRNNPISAAVVDIECHAVQLRLRYGCRDPDGGSQGRAGGAGLAAAASLQRGIR